MNVKIPFKPLQIVSWDLSHSTLQEISPKIVSSLGRLPFFKNLCFQQPLRSYENKLRTWTINVKRPPGPVQFVPWRLSCSILRGKIGHNSFSLASSPFFQSFVYSTTSYVLQKWSFNFHSKCYNTFWTQINCSVKFVTLDNRRKIGQSLFFTGKVAFFLLKVVFSTTL